MSVQNETTKAVDTKGGLVAGSILVTIGLSLLIFKWLSIEMFFPLVLGLVFIAAGIVTRSVGFLIPGGIIGGTGLGIMVMENNVFAAQGSAESGGVMLVSMAVGFLSIILTSKLFTDETHLWPVFPGGALALIGGLVMLGDRGIAALEVLGSYWPLILVVIGLSILVKSFKERA